MSNKIQIPFKKASHTNTSALLLRLMYQTESLLKWNFQKLKDKHPLECSEQGSIQEAEIIAALASIKAYGNLLNFLSDELNQILENRGHSLKSFHP